MAPTLDNGCNHCGRVCSPKMFLHYPTQMWWDVWEVPDDAALRREAEMAGVKPPAEVPRYDEKELGKTQFVFCGRACENEWADILICRQCGGTWEEKRAPENDWGKTPEQKDLVLWPQETDNPRRLQLEDEWRREAVKRGNTAKRQVQLFMVHPDRKYVEGKNVEGYPKALYTEKEVEERQAQLYQAKYDETLAKLEVGSMKARVLRAPICSKPECNKPVPGWWDEATGKRRPYERPVIDRATGMPRTVPYKRMISTIGPRLHRERFTEPPMDDMGRTETACVTVGYTPTTDKEREVRRVMDYYYTEKWAEARETGRYMYKLRDSPPRTFALPNAPETGVCLLDIPYADRPPRHAG
jgi:hypothetical protein